MRREITAPKRSRPVERKERVGESGFEEEGSFDFSSLLVGLAVRSFVYVPGPTCDFIPPPPVALLLFVFVKSVRSVVDLKVACVALAVR